MAEADLADAVRAEQESPAWTAAQFAGEMLQPCGRQLVARLRGSGLFAGYICCRVVAGEAEIIKFAVTGDLRRRGVGGALLVAALKLMAAEGVGRCFLEVRESNDSACRLYEKYGFQRIGVRRKYYCSPEEDALLYQRLPG